MLREWEVPCHGFVEIVVVWGEAVLRWGDWDGLVLLLQFASMGQKWTLYSLVSAYEIVCWVVLT